jgi:hypothetical protein
MDARARRHVDKLLDELRANSRKILAKAEGAARAARVDASAARRKQADRSPTPSWRRRKPTRTRSCSAQHGRRGLRRAYGQRRRSRARDSRVPVLLVRTLARDRLRALPHRTRARRAASPT